MATTMNKVVEYVDEVKPNVYSDDHKFRWMNALDGMISTEVHGAEIAKVYELPQDADTELLVQHPYDDLYALYVMAQIDFHDCDYERYNNSALMFSERLEQYKAWYIQHNRSGKAKNFRYVMG